MVDLNDYANEIAEFITSSALSFKQEAGTFNSLGVYCCPWAAWITTNFNKTKTLEEAGHNCSDFEIVGYGSVDLNSWNEEYDKEEPDFRIKGLSIFLGHDDGDEALNRIVFDFLHPIVMEIKSEIGTTVLLQMLDSECVTVM